MLTTKVIYQKGGERKKRTSKGKKMIEQGVFILVTVCIQFWCM